jgi:uncharacterized LabA/DUF88 family protein
MALFIDGANLYTTAKVLGFGIDYDRLLKEFQSRGTVVRAFFYTTIIEDQDNVLIRPLPKPKTLARDHNWRRLHAR